MTEKKFTNGPWQVGMSSGHNANMIYPLNGDARSAAIAQVNGLFINTAYDALASDPRAQEGLANAHLIASAPELLRALEMIIAGWEFDKETGAQPEISKRDFNFARAAIAKAYGELEL